MKIGIDARLWNETGVGRYIRNLIRELHTLDTKNSYVLFVKEKGRIDKEILEDKRLKIVETTIHWHSLEEQFAFARVLNKEKLDLVHFPYFSLPILYKKPFVVTIHDLIIHHFPTGKASTLPLPLYHAKRIAFSHVLSHGIHHSKKIIVPLQAVKEDILENFTVPAKKVVVTYEGIDAAIAASKGQKAKSQELKNTKYFLYVGNAYPHKNVDGLLQGFAEYKKHHDNDIKLFLVGKEDYFYTRLKKELPKSIAGSVEFLHSVSDEELSSLYAHAVGFVSASFMEGFGLPPLEALSKGCIPILSDIPSFHEVCRDMALYFDPTNSQSIADALYRASQLSKGEKEKLLQQGAKRVGNFSWKKMAEETRMVYESITI